MPELSHVHLAVPDLATLNRIFREGGAQAFPQWLSTDYADRARIDWYGMRGVLMVNIEPPEDATLRGLWPRPYDDWTEPPRGVVLATVDASRAATDLAPVVGNGNLAGDEAVERERLVESSRHQAFDHELADALNRLTTDDHGVQVIEGARRGERDAAALRRVGHDIREGGKVRGQVRLAMHGDGVGRGRL